MRILYFYSWQHFTTGSPKMLATTVELVDRSRHQPLFLATAEGPLVSELAGRGVEILRRPVREIAAGRPISASRRVMGAARWLRRHRIDLLHLNEFGWNQDIVLGAWLARIPVVLHVHTKLRIHSRNLNRFAAWRVLFVSEAHRQETAGLELVGGKARVLHNAIDVERYAGGRDIRVSLDLSPDDTVITTICQLSERKAVDVFLDVALMLLRRSPSLKFLIVGPVGRGEQEYARRQIARAADPNLGGRIRFLGPRQDIPDILRSSDIFFLPSRHETYGLVVAEAMAASLPVVASNVGGIPEIISSAAIGSLAPVDDRMAFASALSLFVDSPERRRLVGAAARQSLDGRFDRATYARALDAIYTEA
jgi:glycosyltransferase involved in cell wall biosynthesis